MRNRFKQILNANDIPSAVFLLSIVAVCVWIAALPLSSNVQKTALRRFHLASSSFPAWSIQQPVPAMYNFENRYWYSTGPLTDDQLARSADGESIASIHGVVVETNLLNHFPTRVITFVGARGFLKQHPTGFFYLSSKYRGQELRSAFKVRKKNDAEIEIIRLESRFE